MRPHEPPLAAIVGPTASGKTDLALAIAARLPVEILVADSRQVYRGMDIGTAKPDAAARASVPHHLLDLAAPDESFSVADWLAAARDVIPAIADRRRLPLVVGGTGLYVTALVDGYDLGATGSSPGVRARLAADLAREGLDALATRLVAVDPEAAGRTDLRNPRRLVRALERAELGGGSAPTPRSSPWAGPVTMVGIRRPRPVLDRRIEQRAFRLFADGLLEEVRALLAAGYPAHLSPMTGHGYAEAARYLAGAWSLEQAVEITVRRTRQYARRQETWFRRDPRIVWLEVGERDAGSPELVDQALAVFQPLAAGATAREG